jgi:hypothetical protein
MKKREIHGLCTILGEGDPSGGDEIIAFYHGGLYLVAASWGFDYGSGFSFVGELDEEEFSKLIEIEFVPEARDYLLTLNNRVNEQDEED